MRRLEGKTIILTGASRGFGRFLSKVLIVEGANLILTVRNLADCNDLGAVVVRVDLKYPEVAVARILDAVDLSAVTGLCNNAAIQGPIGPATQNDWRQWEEVVAVNLMAPVELSRVFADVMAHNGGGKIVNLSGGGAANPRPNFSAYATSKAGLVRFSETLAEELKNQHIDVNCVSPGPMLTDMTRGQDMKGLTQERSDETMAKAADLVIFLLSGESDGVTGRLISAAWDDWPTLVQRWPKIAGTDMYTLRRVVAKDRGEDGWDK